MVPLNESENTAQRELQISFFFLHIKHVPALSCALGRQRHVSFYYGRKEFSGRNGLDRQVRYKLQSTA